MRAHEDYGVVIEAFSVPPDMAAKGITGEVLAAQMLDKLSAMQAATYSFRAPSNYVNAWSNDIKVEIPDTGVSVGEFNRYLSGWLGHETHISGEVWHTPAGIAITARAGDDASARIIGNEADLDGLVQKAAEGVYRSTQPYRYAIYVAEHGRFAEAVPVIRSLTRSPSADDRAWADIGLGAGADYAGDNAESLAFYRPAAEAEPENPVAWTDVSDVEDAMQHLEAALADAREAEDAIRHGGGRLLNPNLLPSLAPRADLAVTIATGDGIAALSLARQLEAAPAAKLVQEASADALQACALIHDAGCVSAMVASPPAPGDAEDSLNWSAATFAADSLLERWRKARDETSGLIPDLQKKGRHDELALHRNVYPAAALASAGLGDFKSAHALIDKTPLDCDTCLRVRGRIDMLEKNWPGANYWFARAALSAPSIPFMWADWGRMLLAKGDYDDAIAKFKLANEKGLHFADPLEMWGEALMLKNRSDLALEKFEEANKYATNWGRLHLKWGEALYWSGDKVGAQKQFNIATRLDLSTADKAELSRVSAARG